MNKLLGLLIAAALPLASARIDAQTIVIDGNFDDWAGIPVLATDPAGDGTPTSVDYRAVRVTNDDENLYFLLEWTREVIMPTTSTSTAGNRIRLYLDGDNDTATGINTGPLGIDFDIAPGYRTMSHYRYVQGEFVSTSFTFNTSGVLYGPTHSGTRYEFQVPRSLVHPTQGTFHWQTGDTLRFQLAEAAEDNDVLPDTGALTYTIVDAPRPIAPPISTAKAHPLDLRLYQQNVLQTTPASQGAVYGRLLNAMQPDIVAWQEVYTATWSNTQILGFFNAFYPSSTGQWYLARNTDCIVVSKYPVLASASVDGNLVCRIDLPETISNADLVVFSAHTPCCDSGNSGRSNEHDRIAQIWRNLMSGTGPFTISPNDPVIMTGDFNMVGYVSQLRSLRDGDIFNNNVYGPDFAPARLLGSLSVVPTRHTHSWNWWTWKGLSESYCAGRLDWVFYSGDAMTLANGFALHTAEMPGDVLSSLGLLASDGPAASDHVPLIADFRFPRRATPESWTIR